MCGIMNLQNKKQKGVHSMKLRYADEAVKEIKQMDPSSAVTARMIRSLIKKEVIPSIPVGNGCRRLIDLDVLMDYLSDPTKYGDKYATKSI